MRQKGFAPIIILLILVFVALVGVAYLAGSKGLLTSKPTFVSYISPTPSPNSSPTADWKTYTNEKLAFSFKYPNGVYKVYEYPLIVSIGVEGTGGLNFEVEKRPNTTILTAFTQDKSRYKEYLDLKLPTPVLKSGVINGYVEQETIFPAAAYGTDMRILYFQRGSDVYLITLQPNVTETVFDQILTTFKFTN